MGNVRDDPKATFDAIIIGAGAAGLMCALTAAQRGRRVLVLEHTDKAGAKILISGGGRCNFTNLHVEPGRFLSANPHFCKSALSRYTQADFIALVERHGIAYHEKTLGQLFCDDSARAIVAMLLAELHDASGELRLGQTITDISKPDHFRVATTSGVFTAPALVLATGGLSIPKMGATGFAYDVAARFGLRITETVPGLVPFRLASGDHTFDESLAGVSLEAIASCASSFRENILFTHRGLSGPAILQVSSYWRRGMPVTVNLLPDHNAAQRLITGKRARPKALPQTVLSEMLPARLARTLVDKHLPARELGNIPDDALTAFGDRLNRWQICPTDTEGYAKAEVTVGGIDTRDLSSKTMEARSVPGLYMIGEAVDVTGWLGGYNFQWAWSSGWCAGQGV